VKVGQAIREARHYRGFSQTRLADLAGVTSRAIGYWENDAKIPDLVLLMRLAEALGVEFVCTGAGVTWRA
jgi:transcriptional regulator with XRE-family HTH domain